MSALFACACATGGDATGDSTDDDAGVSEDARAVDADVDGSSALDATRASDGAIAVDATPSNDGASAADATTVDAAENDAADADRDASADASPDASTDAGPDASRDAGVDASLDASIDAPADAPPDVALDAAPPDAAPDSGSTCAAHGFTGTLVSFDLSAQPGSEASVAASSVAAGITAAPLTRSATVTPVSGAGSINSSNWSLSGSADPSRYYTLTVTPAAGCTLSLSMLAIDVRASSTGPSTADVATSADNFGAHSPGVGGTSSGTIALSATAAGAIEVRIYGYGASGSAGTLRIQGTLSLTGALQ